MILALLPLSVATELGARALGRGGVGFADTGDPAGEQLNLAVASLSPRYTMFVGAELGPDARILLRGGAMDSRTAAFAMGGGYRWISDDVLPDVDGLPGWRVPAEALENPAIRQGAHIGVGVPFLERRLSLAAHARYDWMTSALNGKDDAFNFGFSVASAPIDGLAVAVGVFNLLDTGYDRVSREGHVGVRYAPVEVVGIEVDAEVPVDASIAFATLALRAGVDVQPIEWLALRAGWALESENHFVAAGIAFTSERASIDYGVRVRLDRPERNWHALDVRVEF